MTAKRDQPDRLTVFNAVAQERVARPHGRVSHSPKRLYRLAVAPLLGTLLLVGCNVLNTLMPERAVRGMLETLPQPAGVALIDEVTRGTYGSDERCIGASIERLYGVEVDFQDIQTFYEANLHDFGWQRADKPMTPTWASPTGHFAVAVYPHVEASFISGESIAYARGQYSTVYVMVLSYVNDPDYCRAF